MKLPCERFSGGVNLFSPSLKSAPVNAVICASRSATSLPPPQSRDVHSVIATSRERSAGNTRTHCVSGRQTSCPSPIPGTEKPAVSAPCQRPPDQLTETWATTAPAAGGD